MEAAFVYAPGDSIYGESFSRASTANYTDEAPDQSFLYYPGELQNAATFTRASTATYVAEDGT